MNKKITEKDFNGNFLEEEEPHFNPDGSNIPSKKD